MDRGVSGADCDCGAWNLRAAEVGGMNKDTARELFAFLMFAIVFGLYVVVFGALQN